MEDHTTQMIYGRHPALEAIRAGRTIEKVMLQKGTNADIEGELHRLSKEQQFQLQYVPLEKLSKLTTENHQGIVIFTSSMQYHDAEKLADQALATHKAPLLLILDGITDVRNFGAIARSAECTGVAGIIVQQKGSAPINAASLKASAGALQHLKVGRINSLAQLVGHLQNTGWQVLATDLQATQRIDQVDFTEPTAIVLGAEGAGVSRYLLKSVDDTFIIPQVGRTDSFNVSVAAGIVCYEAMRSRNWEA